MQTTSFELSHLNEAQQQAVAASMRHVLIIAGAGSGKTRVLAERIAWLIQEKGLSPYSLFAVTFTNKAASEMRSRIEQRLNFPIQNLWIGTFHSLAHRLLRIHYEKIGLPAGFQILDSEDQLRLIKRIHKTLNLDEEKWPPKQSQWFIKGQKDEGLRCQASLATDFYTQTLIKVYSAYETLCKQSGLVDFDELLLSAYELMFNHADLLAHYQNRFQMILVDEFQDTNTLQYQWLKLLAGNSGKIMAVGDDDQSIYSFRGAKVENMHSLIKDFPDIQVIRLEQNYRSTGLILKAANAIISHNHNRLGKNLWTQGDLGEPLLVYPAFNETDEAHYIISRIKSYHQQGFRYQDMAILYRSNAQSRILEEHCLRENIPYRIYGGQKFLERAEIKDALAYLRLIINRNDDSAFERVVNMPTRGMGQNTLTLLRDTARANQQSLWKSAIMLLEQSSLSSRAASSLLSFIQLINQLEKNTLALSLADQTHYIIQASGLLAHFQKDQTEKGQARVENLKELVTATQDFKLEDHVIDEIQNEHQSFPELHAFLAQVALETSAAEKNTFEDNVQLMTLHSAKGLEFQIVFLCGLEEGLFPHQLSLQEPHQLEEERRLCYVGITRSRKKLYLSFAETRRLYGYEKSQRPSRFLSEIPAECIQEVRASRPFTQAIHTRGIIKNTTENPLAKQNLKIGQAVQHPKFGYGILLNYEGSGEHLRLQVKFRGGDIKWLVAQYANLTGLNS